MQKIKLVLIAALMATLIGNSETARSGGPPENPAKIYLKGIQNKEYSFTRGGKPVGSLNVLNQSTTEMPTKNRTINAEKILFFVKRQGAFSLPSEPFLHFG